MDEMKLRLSTKFMRGVVSKLIARSVYKKYGYKINIQLNDLDLNVVDGEATLNTNVEIRMNDKEFMKLMKAIGDN